MKIVNERGKLFGIINILDLLIILMIISAGIFGYFYLSSGGFREGEKVTVFYTVELEGLKKGYGEIVKEGDTIKDAIRGFYLGVIDRVDIVESMTWNFNEQTREFIPYFPPNEEVLHVTIKSSGYETESRIISEDNEIHVGGIKYLEGKGFVLSGYVIDLWTEPRTESANNK